MSVRDRLPPILRGDEFADLDPGSRDRLESLAHDAQLEERLVYARDECAARLRQPGASPGVAYLLAATCALNGEVERAHQTLLTLGDELAAAGQWEVLAAVAERALGLERSAAAVHLLIQAHRGLGYDPARLESLEAAWSQQPDDLELALLLAERLGEAGRGDLRRELLASLLPRFAAEARYAGLEEAALEFVEHGEVDGLAALVRLLPVVAGQGAVQECRQLLDIAFPPVAGAERAGEVAAEVRAAATAAVEGEGPTAGDGFRAALVACLRQGVARDLPDAEAVFRASRIEERIEPLLPALERFDRIAALPPGGAVHHATFGAGRVNSNDGSEVLMDFAHARGHRMPYEAARRSLARILEDDLRLLRITSPQRMPQLRAEDPGEVLVRALRALGGAGDAQRLKVFLVGSDLVPAGEWNSFWRRARAAAEKDPRIDSARAFEQNYRLAPGDVTAGEAEIPLPAIEPRKSAKSNLGTLRKFLSQHPQAEPALARRFGRFVERLTLDSEADPVDRARAGLYFSSWFPERAAEWHQVLRDLWEQGLAITDLTGEEEQRALLEVSHRAAVESDAILSALDSRFGGVREEAERFRAQLDAAGRLALGRTLLVHAVRYPGAALRQIEEDLSRSDPPPDPWLLLWAACSLIEERPKPSVAEKVLRWLEPSGALERLLAGRACPEEAALRLRVLLRQWRSSDRFYFPVLDAVERFGLRAEVAAVRAERRLRAEKLFERVGQPAEDTDVPVMTRATWERLQKELERLERELRTTIPASIQKARELGDLKENAEYHSAKLKQANVSKLVASLQLRLARARFVDEIKYRDGVVGPGTEVVLESDRDIVTYWVLGEDEQHHGEHVVSFQAPVGRALVGHSIGDEIELGEGAESGRYRIVSVERKLPTATTERP
ncbi:MAG: hypothetical protein A2W00_14050 [Candidatus Eisenbacteria bacterium RBG_16_71_46]|nr:MAG: hypothetical protein A2W00_14050 [Candidatus Eisenbacteria bacterium RBG_16_71_46]